MRNALKFMLVIVLCLGLNGCAKLGERFVAMTVKDSMQEQLGKSLAVLRLKVERVELTKQGANQFAGVAHISYGNNEEVSVPVDISVDGMNVQWQTKEGALDTLVMAANAKRMEFMMPMLMGR